MATILIVDDIPANRGVLAILVKHRGHRLLEAADGREALEIIRRERPDLVISDILMPVMDGFELLEALRSDPQLAATRVVFYTAYYEEQEVRRLARDGSVTAVITKPSSPEEMLRIIDEVTGASAPAPTWSEADRARFLAAHERLLVDKLSAQTAALEATNERLAALVNVNMQLASARDPDRLLDEVRRAAMALLGARSGVVLARRPGSDDADPGAVSLLPADADGCSSTTPPWKWDRIATRIGGGGALRVGADTGAGQPPRDRVLRRLIGDRSMLAAPIRSLHASYGWICLLEKLAAPEFSAEDEHLLAILAAQSGRLYENGSLNKHLRHQAEQLRRQIDERAAAERRLATQYAVSRLVAQATPADDPVPALLATLCAGLEFAVATLWTVDESDQRLYCHAVHAAELDGLAAFAQRTRGLRLARGEGLPGQVWRDGETVWIEDAPADPAILRQEEAAASGLHTGIAVPLMSRGEITGVLEVFCVRQRPFHSETALAVTTIASHIERWRERVTNERRVARLARVHRWLSEVNAAVIRIRDRRRLYREVCRIAVDAGGFGLAWIAQFDAGGRLLKVPAIAGGAGIQDELQLAAEEPANPVALALARRELQVVDDLGDARWCDLALCRRLLADGLRSLAIVPLITENRTVGVVGLAAREPAYFEAGEVSLTRDIVASLGYAVEFIANEHRLIRQAFFDPLTQLPNRNLFVERLDRVLEQARQSGINVAVAVADVKDFRHVNEVFGRKTADTVLRRIAERLQSVWPDRTYLCRVGGDRFAGMLLGQGSGEVMIGKLIDPVSRTLREPIIIDAHELSIRMTAGIATFPVDGEDAETLMRRAEAAMMHARRRGERYRFFEPKLHGDTAQVLNLEIRLRDALEHEQFVLHYQPVVAIPTRRVVGLEALLRWQDPESGLVAPGKFIPVLEETGLISRVGHWVVRQAMIDCIQWRAQGLEPPRVAVNVSAVQLHSPRFVNMIERAVRGFRRSGGLLSLEITESVLMRDMRETVDKLEAVRRLGVDIAVDDFGTGYSSLGYLARLPVGTLKIDRSFVSDLASSPESMTMVSTIISLARSLGLKTIAEGVETEEQFRLLHLLRCDFAQGYLISKAVPADRIPGLLTAAASPV